jgi:hypothetical protein
MDSFVIRTVTDIPVVYSCVHTVHTHVYICNLQVKKWLVHTYTYMYICCIQFSPNWAPSKIFTTKFLEHVIFPTRREMSIWMKLVRMSVGIMSIGGYGALAVVGEVRIYVCFVIRAAPLLVLGHCKV